MSDTVIYSECSKRQVSVSHIWFVLSMSDLQDSSATESYIKQPVFMTVIVLICSQQFMYIDRIMKSS